MSSGDRFPLKATGGNNNISLSKWKAIEFSTEAFETQVYFTTCPKKGREFGAGGRYIEEFRAPWTTRLLTWFFTSPSSGQPPTSTQARSKSPSQPRDPEEKRITCWLATENFGNPKKDKKKRFWGLNKWNTRRGKIDICNRVDSIRFGCFCDSNWCGLLCGHRQ